MRRATVMSLAMLASLGGVASAQYSATAGHNAPAAAPKAVEYRDAEGTMHHEIRMVKPDSDKYGNAQGNNYDLAVDGAFKGQTVAVIHEYTDEGFDFSLPRKALAEKGFSVFRWSNGVPKPEDLEKALEKSCQLWLISTSRPMLTDAHIKVIKKFFEAGHGVYIWGDNEPYYADANILAKALLGTTMEGNVPGARVVGVENTAGGVGILPNHLLTTGLENVYEGITIATIKPTKDLQPLIYGSADNLVTAFYDHDGKRAILDGGFTRLYLGWETAGTPRYVKNAAAWLVNTERFGAAVVAKTGESPAPAPVPATAPTAPSKPAATATPVTATPVTATDDGMASTKLGLILIAGVLGLGLVCLIPLWVRTRAS